MGGNVNLAGQPPTGSTSGSSALRPAAKRRLETVPVSSLRLAAGRSAEDPLVEPVGGCPARFTLPPSPMLLLPDVLKFKRHDLVKTNHVDGNTSYPPSQRGEYCLL